MFHYPQFSNNTLLVFWWGKSTDPNNWARDSFLQLQVDQVLIQISNIDSRFFYIHLNKPKKSQNIDGQWAEFGVKKWRRLFCWNSSHRQQLAAWRCLICPDTVADQGSSQIWWHENETKFCRSEPYSSCVASGFTILCTPNDVSSPHDVSSALTVTRSAIGVAETLLFPPITTTFTALALLDPSILASTYRFAMQ